MEVGDKVVYYTHEANNNDHSTNDQLAFVTRVVDEATVDLVVIPPGGPITFERASLFDSNDPYIVPGTSYYRPWGEEPPDFDEAIPYPMDGDWAKLHNEQMAELEKAKPETRESLRDKHAKQRENLRVRLAKRYGGTE